MRFHIALVSKNSKTGPIPVTTTSSDSCPDACPLKGHGCFAGHGPLAINWRKVDAGERGTDFPGLLSVIRRFRKRQTWRLNQAGDLPGEADKIDVGMMSDLVAANAHAKADVISYTHKPVLSGPYAASNAAAIADANNRGFTVNLSANSLAHADDLMALGIGPVVSIVPRDYPAKGKTPAGHRVVVCPAQQREGITCATCAACAKADRTAIIAFRAHGTGARKAEDIFNNN